MKTIITKEIDGYKIIIGIGDAGGLIDPEATRKIVNKKIQDTETWKNINQIKKQMQVYANQAMQAKKNIKSAKSEQEKRKFSDEWKFRTGQMKELENDLKPLAFELKKVFRQMTLQEAIYFETGKDRIVEDAEADKINQLMIEATQEGALVDENKNKVVDNRGKVFWKKDGSDWYKTEINKIGVDGNGILESDLSESQRTEIAEYLEKKRIEGLTAAQKTAEKESKIDSLALQADQMKGKLIIQGTKEADALSQAKTWYDSEVAKVESLYK